MDERADGPQIVETLPDRGPEPGKGRGQGNETDPVSPESFLEEFPQSQGNQIAFDHRIAEIGNVDGGMVGFGLADGTIEGIHPGIAG